MVGKVEDGHRRIGWGRGLVEGEGMERRARGALVEKKDWWESGQENEMAEVETAINLDAEL